MLRSVWKLDNLKLAWERIQRTSDPKYKYYYRELFPLFKLNLDANLIRIREELKNRFYYAKPVRREYWLKPSGLTRAVSVLDIEDLIVYQAISNVVAVKFFNKLRPYYGKKVFAHRLTASHHSKYFFRSWRIEGHYDQYIDKIISYHKLKYRHVARLDISSFYDTISHELLLSFIFPRSPSSYVPTLLKELLESWTQFDGTSKKQHGIPQGPDASSFLAELFLYNLDSKIFINTKYLRYVDDIYLLAKDRNSLFIALREIERVIKSLGLIVNQDKSETLELKSTVKFEKSLRKISHSFSDILSNDVVLSKSQQTTIDKAFKTSIQFKNKKYQIKNKTVFKSSIWKISPSCKRPSVLVRILEDNPFLANTVIPALCKRRKSKPLAKHLNTLISKTLFNEHYEAQIWSGLLYHNFPKYSRVLCPKAWHRLFVVPNKAEEISLRVILYEYLLVNKYRTNDLYREFKYEDELIKAQIGRDLIDQQPVKNQKLWARANLKSTQRLTNYIAIDYCLKHGLVIENLNNISESVQNCLMDCGLISRRERSQNYLNECFFKAYGIKFNTNWQVLIPLRFYSALLRHVGYIIRKEDSSIDDWIRVTDSVNHILTALLVSKHLTGQFQKNGRRLYSFKEHFDLDYGKLLNHRNILLSAYPTIQAGFQKLHQLRKKTFGTHPLIRTTHLAVLGARLQDKNLVLDDLRQAYRQYSLSI